MIKYNFLTKCEKRTNFDGKDLSIYVFKMFFFLCRLIVHFGYQTAVYIFCDNGLSHDEPEMPLAGREH